MNIILLKSKRLEWPSQIGNFIGDNCGKPIVVSKF